MTKLGEELIIFIFRASFLRFGTMGLFYWMDSIVSRSLGCYEFNAYSTAASAWMRVVSNRGTGLSS